MSGIIDCHTHLGRNENITARVDELLRSMDSAGIERSLVIAGRLAALSNRDLLNEIRPHSDRLRAIIACHPLAADGQDNLKDLQWEEPLRDPLVVGVKFYLGYEHYFPGDLRVGRALEAIQQMCQKGHPRAAVFHCGDCLRAAGTRDAKLKYAHPLGVDDPATDFPDVKMVIAHMGYPWHRDAAEVVYKNENVYADMSGFVYGYFEGQDRQNFKRVVREFIEVAGSAKRLMFGTDWPISSSFSYVEMVNHMDELRSNDGSVKRAVMHDNAVDVFGLKDWK